METLKTSYTPASEKWIAKVTHLADNLKDSQEKAFLLFCLSHFTRLLSRRKLAHIAATVQPADAFDFFRIIYQDFLSSVTQGVLFDLKHPYAQNFSYQDTAALEQDLQ